MYPGLPELFKGGPVRGIAKLSRQGVAQTDTVEMRRVRNPFEHQQLAIGQTGHLAHLDVAGADRPRFGITLEAVSRI